MYDFPVYECTQEQNGSPNLSSIVLLYRDFVLLLLCYIVLSYVIVGLRVHGCACAVSEN